MKRREVLALIAASAVAESPASLAQQAPAQYPNQIALPKPVLAGKVSLEEALARRRSVRTFGAAALPLDTLGQLLWAGQGITSADGKRTAPSAGALYALDLYVVTASEVIHYLPSGHRAESRTTADLRPQLKSLAVQQTSITSAPAVLVVAADSSRLVARYGARANVYADIEAGHAAQNLLLQATALGLGTVPVGAVNGAGAAQALALPPGQTVIYLIPTGFMP